MPHPSEKLPYSPPQLQHYGSMRELTLSSSTPGSGDSVQSGYSEDLPTGLGS